MQLMRCIFNVDAADFTSTPAHTPRRTLFIVAKSTAHNQLVARYDDARGHEMTVTRESDQRASWLTAVSTFYIVVEW